MANHATKITYGEVKVGDAILVPHPGGEFKTQVVKGIQLRGTGYIEIKWETGIRCAYMKAKPVDRLDF
jgi:hypothetical protein